MQAASWAMHTLADDHTHHADAVICTAGAEDEARTCLEMGLAKGALQHIVSRISLLTIKQVNSGANLLQKVQHLLLFGDLMHGSVCKPGLWTPCARWQRPCTMPRLVFQSALHLVSCWAMPSSNTR